MKYVPRFFLELENGPRKPKTRKPKNRNRLLATILETCLAEMLSVFMACILVTSPILTFQPITFYDLNISQRRQHCSIVAFSWTICSMAFIKPRNSFLTDINQSPSKFLLVSLGFRSCHLLSGDEGLPVLFMDKNNFHAYPKLFSMRILIYPVTSSDSLMYF